MCGVRVCEEDLGEDVMRDAMCKCMCTHICMVMRWQPAG